MVSVTGATGHLGNVLVRELLQQGFQVRAVVLPGEDTAQFLDLDLDIVEADVRDLSALTAALQGSRQVFHLASLISIRPGERDRLEQINIQGTRNVLEACRADRVQRLIYTSSVHAFAPLPEGQVMQEEDPIDPFLALGDYGQTKAQATLDVLAANDRHLQTVVVHPAAIIGPFDYRPSKLGRMVMQVLRGRFPFRPPGSYNFVDVRDVARGEILAAQRGHPGRNYILSNETWTITDFLKEVCQVAGRIWRAVPLPRRVMEYLGILAEKLALSLHREPLLTAEAVDILHTNTRMSCERARRELGYLPRPLRQTLKDEINWFRLLHAI